MGYRYAVIGAGRQGIAAAYDMGRFGDAEDIVLVDSDITIARRAAERINELIGGQVAHPVQADAQDLLELEGTLEGITSFLSAVPYRFNHSLTQLAISLGANMCDLGGNTAVVKKQLGLHGEALEAGITVVPDCGMGPGMNISLATYAMSLLEKPREVYIWDGGLPQRPEPPWNYQLTFNIGGLTNEYYGNATFLRDGALTEVPCFDGLEELDFPAPMGRLEAFVTSGGLSTMPWTFEGKLQRLENKTLRYPGHCVQFQAFSRLGLLKPEPIRLGNLDVVPREVFHFLLEPKIMASRIIDVGVIRVRCVGEKEGKNVEVFVELMDHYDEATGFTAMQRLTGWHASIMAILAARGKLPRGVIPVELAVPGATIVREARKRGFHIEEISEMEDRMALS